MDAIRICDRIINEIRVRAELERLRREARELAELELHCARVAAGLVRNGGRVAVEGDRS